MAERAALQLLLEDILGSGNVYFQPPSSVRMSYPAIVYDLERIASRHADNSVYKSDKGYEVIVIDKNPDSEVSEKIAALPLCRFVRRYQADNLNHDVFTLYF